MELGNREARLREAGWIGAIAFLGVCVASLAARAEEPEAFHMECYEGSQRIFVSDVADIGAFDAASHGVSLLQTMPLPERNLTLYQFGPADVFCLVADE